MPAKRLLPAFRGRVGMGRSGDPVVSSRKTLSCLDPTTPSPTLPLTGGGSYLSARKHGAINHTVATPINIVSPNACNAGVLLKPSKPNDSKVLTADKPTASHAVLSCRLGC